VQIANQVREYLKRGVIQNAVNVPSIDDEQYAQMRPYIALAEKLGAFLANVVSGSVQELSIRYSGRICGWKTELIRNAAIQGVLNQRIAERANVVNAAAIAQERGIQVHESRKDQASGGSGDVVSLLLKTSSDQHLVKGAVMHGSSLRLIGVDDIGIEVPLEGKLIYMRNRDVPGVVGKIGTILGKHNVNIGNFALGRRTQAGEAEAIAVVQVDHDPPETAIRELQQAPEMHEVRFVPF
jgi:D-3-phosphoglycerate dehydrogenase